jgi:hypothetical protein
MGKQNRAELLAEQETQKKEDQAKWEASRTTKTTELLASAVELCEVKIVALDRKDKSKGIGYCFSSLVQKGRA